MAGVTPGIKSIAAGMLSRAADDTKSGPKGVVGGIIEGMTGQIKEFNDVMKNHAENVNNAEESHQKLAKVTKELAKLEKLREDRMEHLVGGTEALAKKTKKLTEESKKLADTHEENTAAMHGSKQQVDKLEGSKGKLSSGVTVLAGKIIGLTAAFFSFRSMLDSVDKRLGYTAKQLQLQSQFTGDYSDAIKIAWEEGNKWNDTINDTNLAMAKMGIHADKTNAIMGSLADGLRLTTNDSGKMRDMVGTMTQDIGHMSVLLQTNTEDLAAATTVASKKFGKSTGEMADDLAGMWDGLKQVQQGSKDTVLHLGDMTQAVLESQASFQGYNFNLRQQAAIMATVSQSAQEQGATYEMSMKAAKGLTDIISGGAPDWAKYVAGDKLLDEIKSAVKGVKDEDVAGTLAKQFNIDPETKAGAQQLKGLKNLAKNHRKYGKLSASYMAEELLRGTEVGTDKMLDLLRKYGTGSEGRELLKRVWGLDDAAATAAMLALESEDASTELKKIIGDSKEAQEAKAPPTMKDVKTQTQEMVNAIGMMREGVKGSLAAILSAITNRPWLNAIVGAIGGVTSGLIQLAQIPGFMGAAKGVASNIPGVGGAAGAIGGAATKAGGAIAGAGSSFAGLAGGGAAGAATAGAGVVAAAAGGVLIGTAMRYASEAITDWAADFTGWDWVRELSVDNLTQHMADGWTFALDKATFGLAGFNIGLNESRAAQDQLTKQIEKGGEVQKRVAEMAMFAQDQVKAGSDEWTRAAALLKNETDEGLKTYAENIAKSTGLDISVIMGKLESMRDANVGQSQLAALQGAPAAGAPAAGAPAAGAPAAGAAGKAASEAAKKAPPVVTVTRLTKAQKKAVATSVATELSPEVAEMARPMFEQMAVQSTEFFESMGLSAVAFWQDIMPEEAGIAWMNVTNILNKKIEDLVSPMGAMTALSTGGEGGEGGMGGASVGPDGSIMIQFMIPRDTIDASTRKAAAYTE